MKFLKKVLMLLFALVGIILIIALFVKKEYEVTRTIEIQKPNAEVFDYLKYLKNHSEFSVWQAMDPNVKQDYSGIDGTVGAIYSWDSKNEDVGTGEQEIMKIVPDKRINYELRFKKPWEMDGQAFFETEAIGDSNNKTKVTWGFKGRSSWPMNIFFLIMDMDTQLGPDLEKGLENLKEVLEAEE